MEPLPLQDPREVPEHLRPVVGDAPVYTVTDLYQGRAGTPGVLQRVQSWGEPWIVGEVTDLKARGEHAVFAVRDPGGKLDCFLHARVRSNLRFELENGLAVLARIRFDVYPQTGKIQGVVVDLAPRDKGPRQLAFEQALARLTADGLLDPARKRPVPAFPRRVGVITSSRGKAIDDLVQNLRRRRPRLGIRVWSASVQGDEAASDLIRAIRGFNRHLPDTDVIVVGRGGGSIDDLWAFNDERLARVIAESAIPVVVSLGHTTDRSLAGLVADVDAPTPSTAAELVTALDEATVRRKLDELAVRQRVAIVRQREELVRRVVALEGRRIFLDVRCLTERARDRVERAGERIPLAGRHRTENALRHVADTERRVQEALAERLRATRERFDRTRIRVHAASPLALLERGYAVAERASDGRTVKAPEDVRPGEGLRLRTHGGDIDCEVTG